MMKLVASICVLLTVVSTEAQTLPASYSFTDGVSVNGSSATGNCSSVTNSSGTITCTDPTSSVLYDWHIPTLTGLDGDMWASQLLTLHTTTRRTDITFDFSANHNRVERVEVVMFNCPEWGVGVQNIRFIELDAPLATISPTITSCDSLVRVCIPARTTLPVITLEFFSYPDSDWVHLAEVSFYASGNTCPPDIIITTPAPPPTTMESSTTSDGDPPTTDTPTSQPNSDGDPPTTDTPTSQPNSDPTTPPFSSTQCEECPSCSTSTLLASVLTAIITALLATAIFLPVLVAVRKCHPNFTPGGAETGTSAGEGVYEPVDEGGVATSNHAYMEIDEIEGRNVIELKQNEAYTTHTSTVN